MPKKPETLSVLFLKTHGKTDPLDYAKKLREKLGDIAIELTRNAERSKDAAAKELLEFEALCCVEAAGMIAKLGTEVTRLRLTIQHYDHGRMTRTQLANAAETWNGDPPKLKQPADGLMESRPAPTLDDSDG